MQKIQSEMSLWIFFYFILFFVSMTVNLLPSDIQAIQVELFYGGTPS